MATPMQNRQAALGSVDGLQYLHRKSGIPAVMNFMCQSVWDTGCQDIGQMLFWVCL